MRQSRTLITIGLALCLAVVAACATKGPRQRPVKMGPVDSGAGSLAQARKYLEGRWTLLSFEVFPAGRPPIQLKGSGTLTYDDFGNLDVQIRVDDTTAGILNDAGIPSKEGVVSTTGRTVVDMQAHTLTYVLEGRTGFDVPRGPLALSRPRHWQVDGDVLTLTTNGDDGKPTSVGRWQKSP